MLRHGYLEEAYFTVSYSAIRGESERPEGILVTVTETTRALDARHLEFFELVARQIANATANATAHDESRRRAEALAEIDRAKTAFFSNVSHEFRTPLTLMLGPLQDVLTSATGLSDAQREQLDVARRNSLRLVKLVNSLLDFSRIEAGRIEASYEVTDVAAFTSELASVFRSVIERAGLRFSVHCAATRDPVFIDREMWEKVVLNLLSNAFKFTFEGEIAVSLRQVGKEAELTVRDTGTGIAAGDLPHVFERFHRVRNARSRSFEGSGIGLALVQELVKLHGGTVRVESEIDRGTCFIVTLPVGSDHLPPDRLGAPSNLASTGLRGEAWVGEIERWLPAELAGESPATSLREARVLVADDNADMRDYLRRLLANRYEVETVRDGIEALEAIRARPPDVVLTDVMMPRLDGFGLLSALRSEPATGELPVVVLSARAGEEARIDGLRAGADDYLVKPFTANELVARVASTVQLARLRREGEARLAEANRELRRQDLEQQTLLEVLPIGIGIATDRECRDIRINRAFAATLGLPPSANASKTAPPGQRPTTFRVMTPDGVEIPDDQLPLQVAAREAREVRDLEFDIVHDDGRVIRLLEYAAPLFDEHGTPRGAVGAFVDVTASHQAQRTLARSEERYRRIFDTAGVSLWEVDYSAVKEALERLRLEEEFPHPRATEVFGPTFRGEAIVRLDDVTKDPRYGRNVPYHGMPAGHLPVRSYLAVPVIARRGQVLGGLFFGHSESGVFTARHEQLATGVASWAAIALDNARLYRDVEEANRMKDEFLATLSHELRTPLNAVLGWAQMLRQGAMKPTMQQRAFESLERNARAQAQLVEDLLDVSRIISGKLHLQADEVDLGTVVANAVDTVRAGAAAKGLQLEVHVHGAERILVTGDPDRLQQIIWNLASNAIKFTPGGGRIDVELRRVESKAEIVVRDTGQGIPASFLPHLFQRFRQIDASMARRHGGLGLGLSIVRHLTEAHGGTVEAESAGEGRGATFRVRLPLRPDESREVSAALDVKGTPHPLAGVTALIVDDEADARDLVRFLLEARGAHVVTAASAGEALHLAGEQHFDVLIADIGMPEQDGYSLIRVLRNLPDLARQGLPAIAVTAYVSRRDRDEALEAGYNWHLPKPIDPDQLVATVSSAVGGTQSRGRPTKAKRVRGTAARKRPSRDA